MSRCNLIPSSRTRFRLFVLGAGLLAPLAGAQDEAQLKLGKKRFLNCNGCHSVSVDAAPLLGPHLEGIVGRKAATVEGFEYTPALRALDIVWSEEELDRFLQAPQALVPELCMPFGGMRKPEDRQALIAWLKQPQP
jgi:cytochrome c2